MLSLGLGDIIYFIIIYIIIGFILFIFFLGVKEFIRIIR